MKNKIKIATLVLTRRCNLQCDYCRFSGDIDYIIKPKEYPDSKYFYENEKPASYWINITNKLMAHNPDIFFILFGGEPFLYKGLSDLVIHLNAKNANYTIISNSTPELEDIMTEFFLKVGKIKNGYTASVDPGFWIAEGTSDHELYKSCNGFELLKRMIQNNLANDPVAEITVDGYNIRLLEETVKRITDCGICSDITVLDISKSNYYDFSAITNPKLLVEQNDENKRIFDNLINSNYNIHMKEILLPKIYNILPANLDCGLGIGNLHNVTIECDGTMRLCGRIRGRDVPKFTAEYDLVEDDGRDADTKADLELCIQGEKSVLCHGCAHTCQLMSMEDKSNNIINH